MKKAPVQPPTVTGVGKKTAGTAPDWQNRRKTASSPTANVGKKPVTQSLTVKPSAAAAAESQNRNVTPLMYQNCSPSSNDQPGSPRATASSPNLPVYFNEGPTENPKPSASPRGPVTAPKKSDATVSRSQTASTSPSWNRTSPSSTSSTDSISPHVVASPGSSTSASKFHRHTRTSESAVETTTPPPVTPINKKPVPPLSGAKGALTTSTSPTATKDAVPWRSKEAAGIREKREIVSVASSPPGLSRNKNATPSGFRHTMAMDVNEDIPPQLPPPRPSHPLQPASMSSEYVVSEPLVLVLRRQLH